jgi:hypothetical protein
MPSKIVILEGPLLEIAAHTCTLRGCLESPDINPIEMVWNQMKRNIARSEPKTKNELLQCIQKFWIEEMTTEQCNMYIDHIYKVLCVVLKRTVIN